MRTTRLTAGFFALCLTLATLRNAAAQATENPILIELFTSEGCSSCPPADRLLQQVQDKVSNNGARIIVLSEHVTYWDQLGWRDPFSSETLTDRQNSYGTRFHLDSVYTPQMVVNGHDQFIGSNATALIHAIDAQSASPAPLHIEGVTASADGLNVQLQWTGTAPHGAKLFAVIAQDMATTPVKRGENAGKTLSHVSVARGFASLGDLNSPTVHVPASLLKSTQGTKRHLVLFLQAAGGGTILGVDTKPL